MDPVLDVPNHSSGADGCHTARSPLGTFPSCPQCDGELHAEHAHYRCRRCGWRDSCCD